MNTSEGDVLAKKKFPTMEITRNDVREFIKYCPKCQKRSETRKFDVPYSPIENNDLNVMVADVIFLGEVATDANKMKKIAVLAVMDLKTHYLFLEELGNLSAVETTLKFFKIDYIITGDAIPVVFKLAVGTVGAGVRIIHGPAWLGVFRVAQLRRPVEVLLDLGVFPGSDAGLSRGRMEKGVGVVVGEGVGRAGR